MIKRLTKIFYDSSGTFEGKAENEEIVLLTRHHPFNIFMKISLSGTAMILPILAGIVLWPLLKAEGLTALFIFFACLWYLATWLGIFYALTMYSLDTMIITNHRVIDHDQLGLFNRHVAELPISRIQDISVHTHGVVETFFNFGDIIIQTASAEQKLTFPRIPHPEKAKDTIMKLIREQQNGVREV